jgi:hypothetical protein
MTVCYHKGLEVEAISYGCKHTYLMRRSHCLRDPEPVLFVVFQRVH